MRVDANGNNLTAWSMAGVPATRLYAGNIGISGPEL
jgi:hypothetical protein